MLVHAPLVSAFHWMVQLEPATKVWFGPGAVGVTSARARLAKDTDTARIESDIVKNSVTDYESNRRLATEKAKRYLTVESKGGEKGGT